MSRLQFRSWATNRFKLVFSGLLLAMLLASLDQTIVATALPTIVRDLGSTDQLSWVVTAYLLGATVSMPLWGRASDLYGRKPLFLAAIVVFLTGSALSGLAGTLGQLIGFRALQGLGAGGLMTLAMAIVGELVPGRERGRYQGYIQIVFIVASVAGPLLGGLFADHASWRWVFYVNLPIGAVTLALITTSLHLPVERRPVKLDYLGAALLAGALTCLLLATTRGTDALYAGFAILLVAFIAQERRAPEPVLPLRLFRQPVFDIVSAALFMTTLALMVVIVFLPLFLQSELGMSATESGFLLLPVLLAGTLSTILSGRAISKTGRYKRYPLVGPGGHGRRPGRALDARRRQLDGDDHRHPAGLRPRLRARVAGADDRDPERRRPPRPRDRDRLGQPLPLARRRGRGRRLRRGLRGRERLPLRRAGGGDRAADRAGAGRGAAAEVAVAR